MQNGQLKVVIEAENQCNALINEHLPQMLNRAQALVGKPIFKQGGTLRKDAEKVLQKPTLDHPNMVYLNRSTYSLGFTFKVCVSAPNEEYPHMSDHIHYAETTVYIGDMEGGVLKDVTDFGEPRRTDYNFDEVRALQKKAREAKAAYSEARSACFPFGED